jgi:hypothetical protein
VNIDDRCESTDWLGLSWSEWHPFRTLRGMPGTDTLTTAPGLYRIRHDAYDRLVYIGETGRSTRGRVGALARGTFADEMPLRDPHTAAPTLWAIRREYGPEFELSWTTPETTAEGQARKGIEATLIALHRKATGESPVANFGRIIPGYEQSGYSRHGEEERGGVLSAGEEDSNSARGREPFEWVDPADVFGLEWMGLDWTTPDRLEDASSVIPSDSGVYRLWDRAADSLTYVGESQNLRSRLYTHRRNRNVDLRFSYAILPDRSASHELLEVETDLLGAHWLATGRTPVEQF